jgi:hypothetical protein
MAQGVREGSVPGPHLPMSPTPDQEIFVVDGTRTVTEANVPPSVSVRVVDAMTDPPKRRAASTPAAKAPVEVSGPHPQVGPLPHRQQPAGTPGALLPWHEADHDGGPPRRHAVEVGQVLQSPAVGPAQHLVRGEVR